MIKVQDFATKYGVTDRQVQRLLKKYEDEMAGHFERQGPNGTWIDETGEKILRSKMRQAPIVLHDSEVGQKIAKLEQENETLKDKLILAMEKIQEQQTLLDDGKASQFMLQAAKDQAERAAKELSEVYQQLGSARQEAQDLREQKEKLRHKATEAEKVAEGSQKELAAAYDAFELELQKERREKQILLEYAAACDAYYALPKWRQLLTKHPTPPAPLTLNLNKKH